MQQHMWCYLGNFDLSFQICINLQPQTSKMAQTGSESEGEDVKATPEDMWMRVGFGLNSLNRFLQKYIKAELKTYFGSLLR